MLHSDAAAPDAAPVKKVGAVEEKYPCYGIPIRVLLDLEAWVPHQDLLEMGKLVRMGGRDMAAGRDENTSDFDLASDLAKINSLF